MWVKKQDGSYQNLDNGCHLWAGPQTDNEEVFAVRIDGISTPEYDLIKNYSTKADAQTALDNFMTANYSDSIRTFDDAPEVN